MKENDVSIRLRQDHEVGLKPLNVSKKKLKPLSVELSHFISDIIESAILILAFFTIAVIYMGLDVALFNRGATYTTLAAILVYQILLQSNRNGNLRAIAGTSVASRMRYLCFGFFFAIMCSYFLKGGAEVSRVWVASSIGVGVIILVLYGRLKVAVFSKFLDQKKIGSHALLYGSSNRSTEIIRVLSEISTPLQVEAVVDVRNTRTSDTTVPLYCGISMQDLTDYVGENSIDAIVIDLPTDAVGRIGELERAFESVNVDILMAPSPVQLSVPDWTTTSAASISLIALYERPVQGLGHIMKSIVDRLGAAFALVLVSPILILTALAICLESKGGFLFLQPRMGFNNKPFKMLKFRSMYADVSDMKGSKLTERNDSRVTICGKFIRRTSIDELPQIINILRGEMSFVGPRPHAFGAKAGDRLYEDVVSRYAARHRVKPGLTGLAQVRGFRGNTETEADILNRVDSDLEYIRRWSIWFDIEIIVRTAVIVFWQKNAF